MSKKQRSNAKEMFFALLGDRPIAYHPMIAHVLGDVKQALFTCQLLYWHDKGKLPDGWIWKTQQEWTEETGLSRYEQQTARKHLIEKGVLQEKLRNVPATLHYRLDLDRLYELTEDWYEMPPVCDITTNWIGALPQSIPETTSEITEKEEEEKESREISFDDLKGHSQSISNQPAAPIRQGFEPSVADPSEESPDVEELARQLAPPIDLVWGYDKATDKSLLHAARELLKRCKGGDFYDILDALDEYLKKNGQWARENIDSPMGLITLVARQYQKMQGQAERKATAHTTWAEDIEASRQAWAKRQVHTKERDPWWEKKLNEMQWQMDGAVFDAWLRGTSLLERDGERIVIGVRDERAREWLDKHLRCMVKRAVAADGVTDVVFEVIEKRSDDDISD